MTKALVCAIAVAAALAAGCQSNLPLLGPVKPDEPGRPPTQPAIEPFDELMPQAAYGPTGPRATRDRLVARLRLSPPNESYSLFMTDVKTHRGREDGLWWRCQSIYVARTETFGQEGPAMGGSSTCTSSAIGPPSWSPLELRQISCYFQPQLTVGTVSADLDGVRLTFSSGAVRMYRLDGPLLRNARHRRVFLLDHGALRWTRAEGVRDGRAIASESGAVPYCD